MSSQLESVRVLVVDTDTLFARSLAIELREKGYVVRTLYASEEASEAVEDFCPHALVCEVVMPGMNGIDLANRVTDRCPECRVLLMSDTESVIEVMEDSTPGGVVSFLRKPVHLVEVLEFLAECLPPQ